MTRAELVAVARGRLRAACRYRAAKRNVRMASGVLAEFRRTYAPAIRELLDAMSAEASAAAARLERLGVRGLEPNRLAPRELRIARLKSRLYHTDELTAERIAGDWPAIFGPLPDDDAELYRGHRDTWFATEYDGEFAGEGLA